MKKLALLALIFASNAAVAMDRAEEYEIRKDQAAERRERKLKLAKSQYHLNLRKKNAARRKDATPKPVPTIDEEN